MNGILWPYTRILSDIVVWLDSRLILWKDIVTAMASDIHNKLVEVIGKSPSREWMEEFFEYAHELLSYEEIEYHENDDRLVTSVQSDRIAVTMNSRYVLVAFLGKERMGFIVRGGSKQIDNLIKSAEGHYSFKTLQDEQEGESPDWVEFSNAEHLENDSIRQNWLTASSIELNRWNGSPSKNSHQQLVQRIVTDEEYRETVLDEAFGST